MAAFAHEEPDRVPAWCGATYRSPFGIEREGLGYGQPIGHPLPGATIDAVHAYPWPDPGFR